MALSTQQVIPAQTAAHAKVTVNLTNVDRLPASLEIVGISGSDSIPVAFSHDDGATSTPASQNGIAVALDSGNNIIKISSPVTVTLTKGVTTGTVGVFIRPARGEVPIT